LQKARAEYKWGVREFGTVTKRYAEFFMSIAKSIAFISTDIETLFDNFNASALNSVLHLLGYSSLDTYEPALIEEIINDDLLYNIFNSSNIIGGLAYRLIEKNPIV